LARVSFPRPAASRFPAQIRALTAHNREALDPPLPGRFRRDARYTGLRQNQLRRPNPENPMKKNLLSNSGLSPTYCLNRT